MYRLKFNQSGSWRNVLDFQPEHLDDVQREAKKLADIAGRLAFKIVKLQGKDEGLTVFHYDTHPRYQGNKAA